MAMQPQITRFTFIFLLSTIAACASGKSSQQGYGPDSADLKRNRTIVNSADRSQSERRLADSEPNVQNQPEKRSTDVRPKSDLVTVKSAELKKVDEWTVTAIKGKFLTTDTTSARIYLELTVQRPETQANPTPVSVTDLTEHFILNYVLYPDYNNRERLGYGNVPLSAQNVFRGKSDASGEHLILLFDVKRPNTIANALLLSEITETSSGKKSLNDLPIRFVAPRLLDRFTLFDAAGRLPRLRNFARVNDTLVIRDVAGTSKPLHVIRYRHEFEPAASPINLTSRPAPKALTIDSTLTVMTNQPFQLPAEGLYFFQDDTTATNGIGILIGDDRFPRLTRPERLVKPVMYMSTSQENNELSGASDFKKALDRYWLSLMSGNEEVARQTIKTYYKHVEDANRLFTTYKEGWKTDKGMIYIILGAPDRVQRSRDREVWVYTRRATTSELNFTFNKRPNQFVEDHYELVRFAEYQSVWFPIVESWRNGAIHE